MSPEWAAIAALIALFVIGTVLPINMGALGFAAAWIVGVLALDLTEKDIVAGISGDLVLTLIGVTYLFAIAKNNGTVDLIVHGAIRLVGGRVGYIPWVMFAVTGVLTAIGAASPAACAVVGPIALGFAGRHKISPLLMGMFVVHGAQAGGFSPISIYGVITNGVMEEAGLPVGEIQLFLASLVVNFVIALMLFFALGGRALLARRLDDELEPAPVLPGGGAVPVGAQSDEVGPVAPTMPEQPVSGARQSSPRAVIAAGATAGASLGGAAGVTAPQPRPRTAVPVGAVAQTPGALEGSAPGAVALQEPPVVTELVLGQGTLEQKITLGAIAAVAVFALFFDRNIGFTAITAAVLLNALFPAKQKNAINHVAWSTVLLVAGMSCFAAILNQAGAPSYVGEAAAALGIAVLGALLLCYVGGVVSAFASSTALLPVIIPIAVPLIASGNVSAIGFVAALAISTTIVDVSPFSTNGALMVANRPDTIDEQKFYKQILNYSVLVVLVGPLLVWAAIVLPAAV